MVKVLECGARGPGVNSRPRQKFFLPFQMDIEEVEVIKFIGLLVMVLSFDTGLWGHCPLVENIEPSESES